jgi:glycosyltransferase involved in cell wall biosynthesis
MMHLESAKAPDGGASAGDDMGERARFPLVSLGLPVYNGANYLAEALESLLLQTYSNWELILSDNGSTDATEEICRAFADRDPRIRYHREPANRGATWNFNRVVELARGPLFRWAAHDDVCAPELLERCVEALEANPLAVLCHPRTRVIGPVGELLEDYGIRLRTDSGRVGPRFHDLICVDHACFPIFGVIRLDVLKRTPLLGQYSGSDRNLLAELSMHGPFHEVPEFLFLRRDHPGTSTRQYPSAKDRRSWFKVEQRGPNLPTVRRALGYLESILRSPLGPADRLICLGILGKWSSLRLRSLIGRNLSGLIRLEPAPGPFTSARNPETPSLSLKRILPFLTAWF